jgi:type II restriction/modification system DNA methylase subunit YeeA
MDKNAIKKYAVWARRELISRVTQKAYQYGIREGNIIDDDADSINGKLLTENEKKERQALIVQVNEKGFKQVMEEAAYTWFNRFSALRFMEVNGYLPTHVRVFTDDENNFKPQILTEAIHLELNGLDMDRVYELKEANNDDELFKYLIIIQCNALNKILPGTFQKITDYTELLFPDNLLREGSVVEQMIALIPEEDWTDQVQIIGWLYQYYNSEPKDTVFANLKKNIKITKENIPAATQLFTPDWIVHYMVENSLGRLWLEGHPNDRLKSYWKYYLDEAKQEADVQAQLDKIREEYKTIKPEEIRIIDPCMGSGHILVYAFDVLMQIYEAYGYNQREAAKSTVENNLYGLDIDDRAAQLAYFSVMMKARQYDRRFFSRGAQPHVYAIHESNHLDKFCVDYFVNGDAKLKEDMQILMDELYDAKEYGSILNVTNVDFHTMYARFDEIKNDINIEREAALNELLPFIQVAQAMAQKYDVVCTNPPYMGSSGMNAELTNYVKKNYINSKSDLFAVFIERCEKFMKKNGFQAMITQQSWMFLSSFEKLRKKMLSIETVNMAHLGARAFEEIGGEVVQTTTFVRCKIHIANYKDVYVRLVEPTTQDGKEDMFLSGINRFVSKQDNFSKISGSPIAYWVSKNLLNDFYQGTPLCEIAYPRQGMATTNNNLFLRQWYEVKNIKIGFSLKSEEDTVGKYKWFPYNKGGEFRKWYGNNDYVVNFQNKGEEVCAYIDSHSAVDHKGRVINRDKYFKPCITWSKISSGNISFRYKPNGFIFDVAGTSIFGDSNTLDNLIGFLNSKVVLNMLTCLSPTLNYEVGHICSIPVLKSLYESKLIHNVVENNIMISKLDWDSFETSWDFKRHPMLIYDYQNDYVSANDGNINLTPPLQHGVENQIFEIEKGEPKHPDRCEIENCFEAWKNHCNKQFTQLKANEEELNRIFIDIYDLQDELTPEEEDKDVTVHYICDSKEDAPEGMKGSNYLLTKQDVVKSFISYAIGCMFGRYSLDVDGLAYAGGEWDAGKYKTYPADEDNIIPICDDEYFPDDIVGKFVKFVETVYGKETLEDNLQFIADALGGKGTPREIIRKYFLNDFYKDHCKTYKKRPIYWLFDSGKKNGFKALIYMHRYQPDTIARIRTDYVHEQQERYRTTITHLEQRINDSTSTSERVKLNKELEKLQGQAEEIRIYEEKIHHLADQMISIDLDDGVKHNYEIFKDVLAKIK